MEDEIKIVRLSTGEDVICSVYRISRNKTIVIEPMVLHVKYKGKESTVIMVPWLPVEVIKSNCVLIENKHIITEFDPNDGLQEYYTNLVNKLRKSIEKRKSVENIQVDDDSIDIMYALEEAGRQTQH